jgi:cytoskeleton protein RodZ
MNEERLMSDPLQAVSDAQTSDTPGAMLRAAREAQGLHVAALAVSLKVPVKKLEALEADRLDALPDAVFARALASSMCRALKVDAAPILARLPQTSVPRLNTTKVGINAPFPGFSDNMRSSSQWRFLKQPAVLAVGALLIGTLVLLLMPDLTKQATDAAANLSATLPGTTNVGNSDAPAASVPGTLVSSAVASTSASAALSPVLSMSAALTTPTLASPTPVITTQVMSTSVAAVDIASVQPAQTEGLIVFKAKGQTWVEVTDARGKLNLRRTLEAGESVGTNGALPLNVTVGRVDQTEISVRGKPFNQIGKVRENVAHFVVK